MTVYCRYMYNFTVCVKELFIDNYSRIEHFEEKIRAETPVVLSSADTF